MRIPRINHFRHRIVERLRHSARTNEWLDAQVLRTGKTSAELAELLRTHNAKYIEALPDAVPTDP